MPRIVRTIHDTLDLSSVIEEYIEQVIAEKDEEIEDLRSTIDDLTAQLAEYMDD